jgi:hypothetical protein
MRPFVLLLLGALLLPAQQKRLAFIDFYGQDGLEVQRLRQGLSLREGDPWDSTAITRAAIESAKAKVRADILRAIGREPSDVALVCCTDANRDWMMFIGLTPPGRAMAYQPAPTRRLRLPKAITNADAAIGKQFRAEMMQGPVSEDDSEGYALFGSSSLRERQRHFRDLARRHHGAILRVLSGARDALQRAIAATALGYARPSEQQIKALVAAVTDADADVRNNATRALIIVVAAEQKFRPLIPMDTVVALLGSGVRSDRNKGVELAEQLAPENQAKVAERASVSLREMAAWHNPAHGATARELLRRP